MTVFVHHPIVTIPILPPVLREILLISIQDELKTIV